MAGLQMVAADPPSDETPSSLPEVETLRRLKGGNASGTCTMNVEKLKVGSAAMTDRLQAVPPVV